MFDFIREYDDLTSAIFIFTADVVVDGLKTSGDVEKTLQDFQLIFSEYALLELINRVSTSDPPNISQLSEGFGVTNSTMVTRLNNLEDKGLVARERDKDDRRKVYISLTAKGQKIIDEIGVIEAPKAIGQRIAHLSEDEQEIFLQLLKKINTHSEISDEERSQLLLEFLKYKMS